MEELLRASESLSTAPLLEVADAAGLTPLAAATLCCISSPPLPSHAAGEPAVDSSIRLRALEMLIAAGANVDADSAEDSIDLPLLVAIGGEQPLAVRLLLQSGADGRASCLGSRCSCRLAGYGRWRGWLMGWSMALVDGLVDGAG